MPPAKVQLARPARNAILRPLLSATGPETRRPASATTEKMPMTKPIIRSEPPRSFWTCGASSGSTVPIPTNPRNVAPINAQKRGLNPLGEPTCFYFSVLDWEGPWGRASALLARASARRGVPAMLLDCLIQLLAALLNVDVQTLDFLIERG